MDWMRLADQVLTGAKLSVQEAAAVLNAHDDDLLAVVDAAYRVRRHYFGRRVKLNFLLNAKSGLCPEDCNYCSQSKISDAPIEQYSWMNEAEVLKAAGRAVELKAKRFCMVASGLGPTDGEVDHVAKTVERVKAEFPNLEICVCLGLLKAGQAQTLKDAGVFAYNHNLNTSQKHYDSICSTHDYADREATVEAARQGGLSACSGALFGMGESDDDRLAVAFRLREIGADSIPINFLMPIAGTPMSGRRELSAAKCLKILAMVRLVNPSAEIRIAGGRELHLGWLQPLGLLIANSVFIGDYLTTKGQAPQQDIQMIEELGFTIEGQLPSENAAQPEFAATLK